MCKINLSLPVIPEGATDNERRKIMFDYLSSLDLSEMVEKREKLSYLSWANALSILRQVYPDAEFRVIRNENGLPYFTDPETGIMVFTEVTIDGLPTQCFLPVMDYKNQAMKLTPYTYQVWDRNKSSYIDKTVDAATMFDINKTIWRCLVKNVALATGIGLYLYQGEDVPEKSEEKRGNKTSPKPVSQVTASKGQSQPSAEEMESIKKAINSTTDVASLVSIYMDNTSVFEENAELKTLLTNRKKALNSLKS